MTSQRLLITGSAGHLGRFLRPRLARPGRVLRLLDVAAQEPAGPEEDVELVTASITDPDAMAAACQGVDAVIHLGGHSREAPWADILDVNVNGTHTVLEAARLAGVQRVLLASSNHAVGFYTRDDAPPEGLPADVAPRPDTYYGFSKAAMESLGSLFHDRYGMDVIALRIGTCFEQPVGTRGLATWMSPDDCARLMEACLATPNPGFRLIWGISRNTRRWWSLAEGEAIGYDPVDDAEKFAAEYIAEHGEPDLDDPVHRLLGGQFCLGPVGVWAS
jgi:NAD(P)-dependent dehydrogenase (short-subunit alcohol dehydrogenase family)